MDSLESYRLLLHALVRDQVSTRLADKLDLSGVVQQTLLDAHVREADLGGYAERQRIEWLRTALANNLRDEIRKLHAQARDVRREVRLSEPDESLDAAAIEELEAEITTPGTAAVRTERHVRLAVALAELPPDQRRAVELRHLGGLGLEDIAAEVGRSPQAVAGLLYRGLRRLRELMPDEVW